MFVRGKRKSWAPGVIPLMLVPFVNIVYSPIGRHIARHDPTRAYGIRFAVYVIAFLGASVWISMLSRRLPSGGSRAAYILCSVFFTAALIVLFIVKVRYA